MNVECKEWKESKQASQPLVLRRRSCAPDWDDRSAHRCAFAVDPVGYALEALMDHVDPTHRTKCLCQLLHSPVGTCAPEVQDVIDRATCLLLAVSAADDVLAVFLALRRERVNRRRVRRFIVRYLLNHPCLPDLVARRRPAVRDCLEHALGRNAVRAIARTSGTGEAGVGGEILRYVDDVGKAREAIARVYDGGPVPGPSEDSRTFHRRFAVADARPSTYPRTITPTTRGNVAAALVHLYRGGDSPMLRAALGESLTDAVARVPFFPGTVGVVLDASGSTRGYGEREFACVSQSVALKLVIERSSRRCVTRQVGGTGDPPIPAGSSDLAGALLSVLAEKPDVVAIISDGYENALSGDLADVVDALGGVGIETPVVFCTSMFTHKDALDYRRPAPALPELAFWHEDDFSSVLQGMYGAARGPVRRQFLEQWLNGRYGRVLKEVQAWLRTHS